MPIHTVHSPLPGTFYRKPSPDAPTFKEIGEKVSEGEIIGLIEVMKTFTRITAEVAGTIVIFHVDDEDAVMAGQPLVDIET